MFCSVHTLKELERISTERVHSRVTEERFVNRTAVKLLDVKLANSDLVRNTFIFVLEDEARDRYLVENYWLNLSNRIASQ